jgi:hypothetical protein
VVPIVVFWTNYTATVNGRVLKLVPCEDCGTVYVYVLEREGTGAGTSVYLLNDEGAQRNAVSSAGEALRDYLANDFDPVPCPACGHYQRFMFPKLIETRSAWAPVAAVAVLAAGGLAAVTALYTTIGYLDRPNDRDLWRLAVAWPVLAVVAGVGYWLSAVQRARVRNFDPNGEDRDARIEKGRARALTRAEFETMQQQKPG